MRLENYKEKIRPEHWKEFQELLPEKFKVKNDDFSSAKNQMAISPETQMSVMYAWENAAEIITVKYNYDDSDDFGEDEEVY
jgi:hypothetical protein